MTFTVELIVTDYCNLGCKYCYVDNRPRFMTFGTFQNVYSDLIYYAKATGNDKYYISFFGGEPLLNFELIKQLTPFLKADKRCSGFSLVSNLTMLNDEIYDFLINNNIPVSWSFDGIDCNGSRPLLPIKENKPFTNILDVYNSKKDKILDLANSNCKTMIYPNNVSKMIDNFKFMLDYGIMHQGFTLVRDDIWTKKDILLYKHVLHDLVDVYAETLKTMYCSIGLFKLFTLDMILGLTKGKRPNSCFAGGCGCCITPDGEFYACQRFASKKTFKYNKELDFISLQRYLNPINHSKCQKCKLSYVCNAGCLYSEILNDFEPLDSICELFQITFEETVRLNHIARDIPNYQLLLKNYINSIQSENNG